MTSDLCNPLVRWCVADGHAYFQEPLAETNTSVRRAVSA